MSIEKMREEFEAWIRAEVERDDRIVRIVRERNRYSGRDKHFLNTSWAAWQASHEALLNKQAQEQEAFIAHLSDFEPEDTFHG